MRAAVSKALFEMARADSRIMIIGSDLGPNAFEAFERAFPERTFMEGISEQYVVGMAAGMAAEGLLPYAQTIATFLTRRAFEQIYIDVGLQNLPVRLIGSGSGLVYSSLGPTHTAIDDLAILTTVPNLMIVAPRNPEEVVFLLKKTCNIRGPVYFRIGKGPFLCPFFSPTSNGSSVCLNDGGSVLIVSTGTVSDTVCHVVKSNASLSSLVTHLHVPIIRPFPINEIVSRARGANTIIAVEEHIERGGLFTDMLHALNNAGIRKTVYSQCIAAGSGSKYGSYLDSLDASGLSTEHLSKMLLDAIK